MRSHALNHVNAVTTLTNFIEGALAIGNLQGTLFLLKETKPNKKTKTNKQKTNKQTNKQINKQKTTVIKVRYAQALRL